MLAITIIVLIQIKNKLIYLQIAYIAFSNFKCLCLDLFTLITNILYAVCETGFWGAGCANVCHCASNAVTCEASSGRCVCEAGYTGDQCDKSESVLLLFHPLSLSLFQCFILFTVALFKWYNM